MSRISQGFAISVGLHAAVIALIIFAASLRPASNLPYTSPAFAHAIAVTLAHPQPQVTPQPQPQPQIKPSAVKPLPVPQAIQSTAIDSDLSIPPPLEKPPPETPPQETSQPEQASYDQIVSAILRQHKHYPREAMLAGQEGIVVLSFVVNRQGTVLAYTIVQSSGKPVFENEVRRMIHSVQFPPFPDSDTDQRKKFQVAIKFQLYH